MQGIVEFVDSLNLPFEGKAIDDRHYKLTVDTSDDFARLFTSVTSNNLTSVQGSVATEEKTEFTYTNGTYDITLKANYDLDKYEMYVEEN